MFDDFLLWLAKQALAYAVNYLAEKLGFERAKTHILNRLEDAKPLTPDPNPSLMHQNNPNKEIV